MEKLLEITTKKKTELMKKTNRNIIIASEERKVGDENSL